ACTSAAPTWSSQVLLAMTLAVPVAGSIVLGSTSLQNEVSTPWDVSMNSSALTAASPFTPCLANARSSVNTLVTSTRRNSWNRKQPDEFWTTAAVVSAAAFGSVPVSPDG